MKELLDSIDNTIAESSLSFKLLSDDESYQVFKELKNRFEFDYSKLFIWDDNKYIVSKFSYNKNWEELLNQFLSTYSKRVYLIISAEQYYPWKIYLGDKDEIVSLVEEQIYFEYIIVDQRLESVLVDTHDNELIKLSYHCKT